ncbi:transcription antitermination factor NusB [Adlercreutzia sp. R25]|uniref:transcription antitermination factor NusB n=1 Tax=Adlercreutzia shanghongiae TaxID=3111773 RepID=UPI002DB80FFC|nr:transcription antitermination factor NusB [Adlercreutzia sp. R25]MEC4273483.1 transcription antitermination factor NusB [Adlercreutzia sp. R25]
MARTHERTRDRISAVQVLYTSELTGKAPSELLDCGLCLVAREAPASSEPEASEFGRIEEGSLTDYALTLIRGVEANQSEVDERVEAASENWALSRMPIVDRSILRLAVFEMLHCEDVPVSVSINEAVELAKGFGGEDDSPRFVNGVLGRIARSMDGEAALGCGDADAELAGGLIPAVVGASGAAACVQVGV